MKIVIEGAGEIGSHLAKMLREEAERLTSDEAPYRSLTDYEEAVFNTLQEEEEPKEPEDESDEEQT